MRVCACVHNNSNVIFVHIVTYVYNSERTCHYFCPWHVANQKVAMEARFDRYSKATHYSRTNQFTVEVRLTFKILLFI